MNKTHKHFSNWWLNQINLKFNNCLFNIFLYDSINLFCIWLLNCRYSKLYAPELYTWKVRFNQCNKWQHYKYYLCFHHWKECKLFYCYYYLVQKNSTTTNSQSFKPLNFERQNVGKEITKRDFFAFWFLFLFCYCCFCLWSYLWEFHDENC